MRLMHDVLMIVIVCLIMVSFYTLFSELATVRPNIEQILLNK